MNEDRVIQNDPAQAAKAALLFVIDKPFTGLNNKPPVDWADRAVQAILWSLKDYRATDMALLTMDDEVLSHATAVMTHIVRQARRQFEGAL